jgi:hypothetical protein
MNTHRSSELQNCINDWKHHGKWTFPYRRPVEWRYATDDSAIVYYNPGSTGSSTNSYGFRHPLLVKMQYDHHQRIRIEADRTHRINLYVTERRKDALTPTWANGNRHRRYSVDAIKAAENTSFGRRTLPRLLHAKGHDLKIYANDPILSVNIQHGMRPEKIPNVDPEAKIYEAANASLSRFGFDTIMPNGMAGWFNDEVMDNSLDLLARILECDKHRIAISSVGDATDMFKIGHWIEAKNECLMTRPDMVPYYEDQHFTNEALTKFRNKDFIVFPINDGYAGGLSGDVSGRLFATRLQAFRSEFENVKADAGRHWSCMIVDCRPAGNGQLSQLTGFYLDSLFNFEHSKVLNQCVANYILTGVQMMFNNTTFTFAGTRLLVDRHTPSQVRHNHNQMDGGSACGPFVWLMAKEFIQYIVECHENNKPVAYDLRLPADYAQRLDWNSAHTRKTIQSLIKREIRVRKHLNEAGRSEWFEEPRGAKNGWKDWLERNNLPQENWFWDPYTFT